MKNILFVLILILFSFIADFSANRRFYRRERHSDGQRARFEESNGTCPRRHDRRNRQER